MGRRKGSVESFGLDFADELLNLFVFGLHHVFEFAKLQEQNLGKTKHTSTCSFSSYMLLSL
jgi:hypothetical protein